VGGGGGGHDQGEAWQGGGGGGGRGGGKGLGCTGVRVYSTVQCTYKLHVYIQGGGGGGGQPAGIQPVGQRTSTLPTQPPISLNKFFLHEIFSIVAERTRELFIQKIPQIVRVENIRNQLYKLFRQSCFSAPA
jgi:hypothetical protein